MSKHRTKRTAVRRAFKRLGGIALLGTVPWAYGQGGTVRAGLPEDPATLLPATGAMAAPWFAASVSPESSGPVLLFSSSAGADALLSPEGQQSAVPVTGQAQGPVGADGKPIRPQTGRIFGVFPNFVAVSGGTRPKPAGWKTDFVLANKQNYDYSSFGFLLMSSALAYGQNSHPSLNTVDGGDAIFWAYLWRGFLDKTDGTYQGTFFFPALLHEDTRYYALGTGPARKRLLHAVESVVVAHNYDQKPIFNLAAQMGRAGTQAVSTVYYPAGSESFGVLAEKFAYSNMRAVIYAVVREFSPDAQAFVASRHARKKANEASGKPE